MCHATDDRRVAALAVGTHAFVGCQFHASIAYAVEQVGIREDIAGAELALERRDVVLQVAAVALEGVRAPGAAAVVGLVAQSPPAQVDSVT
ncbi:hypothetical protein D3C77_268130 [compost metagenome]